MDIDTKKATKWGIRAGFAIAALITVNSSVFKLDQTENGFVTRFGTVQGDHTKPLESGLHFKIPFIESYDKIQVTLQTLHIPAFDVLTVDNQKVTIDENFNFTIPKEQVYHVMYEVGGAGNVDIKEQVVPVAMDRTRRVLASQNMITVNANNEVIQQKIEDNVKTSVSELFGVTAHSLQIKSIRPSDSFMASIDAATMAKNEAVKAENQLKTKGFEAQQVAATAKGAADAAIENARGQAESVRLNAQANADATVLAATAEKTKLELQGKGEQARLASEISALGGSGQYIEYLNAKARLRWDGSVPQVQAGNGSATNLVLPLPSLATKSALAPAP
jgi:regulator of protease activity HflC (stomatin/prohibitin superfamily)